MQDNFKLQEFDIARDSIIFEKYFLLIPVVELDGKIVFQATDIEKPGDIETKLDDIFA